MKVKVKCPCPMTAIVYHHALNVNVNTRPQSVHMVYFRNDLWTEDLTLKEELSKFERQGIQ